MTYPTGLRSTLLPQVVEGGVWEKAVQALARWDREREGRYASPNALVMDSQSVKTTEKGDPGDTTGRRRSKGGNAR